MNKKILLAFGLLIGGLIMWFGIGWYITDVISSVKLEGFKGERIKVGWSPDGKTLATTSTADSSIRLWSPNGKLIDTLTDPDWYGIYDFAWSPDSQLIAFAPAIKDVIIINVQNKTKIKLIGQSDVGSLAWSPDGKILASGSKYKDITIKLWTSNGQLLSTLVEHSDGVTGLAWSPDGRRLASSSYNYRVSLWTLEGQLTTTFRLNLTNDIPVIDWLPILPEIKEFQGIVRHLAWSPDGTKLVGGFRGGTVRLWDKEGKLLVENTRQKNVDQVAWSPDGQMFASAGPTKTIVIWDLNGNFKQILEDHTTNVETISWSPDSTKLASGSWDRTVRIWKIK